MTKRKKTVFTNVLSFSGGKDSTAMLLSMLERNERIHSVVWFDTEREFPEIRENIEDVVKYTGVRFQRIRHWAGFDFMEERYGPPHKSGGWCTAAKRDCCNRYMRMASKDIARDGGNFAECIGFAFDEGDRVKGGVVSKSWQVRFPLIEYKLTEANCLSLCKSKGFCFGGIYDWMPSKRVSCYDCPKQSKADWCAIEKHHPELILNSLRKPK